MFGKLPTGNENVLRLYAISTYHDFYATFASDYGFYETFTKITMTISGQSQGGLHYLGKGTKHKIYFH